MTVTSEGITAFLETNGGWIGKIGPALVFFGDQGSHLEQLKSSHANFRFSFLNQVHSDQIRLVESAPDLQTNAFIREDWPEADAQMTSVKNLALCIRTADCVPVVVTDGQMIAAIHAGWRGLESDILQKTILRMREMGAEPRNLRAAIGPHIGRQSFEVERDVAERLNVVFRKLRFNPAPISHPHPDDSKRFVDMSVLAQAQLVQGGVSEKMISLLRADTFSENRFHSYRRDKTGQRQISFIVLI